MSGSAAVEGDAPHSCLGSCCRILRRSSVKLRISPLTRGRRCLVVALLLYWQEGFNPARVGGDTILLRDAVAKTFVPLTQDLYDAICNETLRL